MQAIRCEAQVSADHILHIPAPDLPEGTVDNPDWTLHFGKFARFDSLEGVNRYADELREDCLMKKEAIS